MVTDWQAWATSIERRLALIEATNAQTLLLDIRFHVRTVEQEIRDLKREILDQGQLVQLIQKLSEARKPLAAAIESQSGPSPEVSPGPE
jgi:hypothetical protein